MQAGFSFTQNAPESQERWQKDVSSLLHQLETKIGAHCSLLVNINGHILATHGETRDLPVDMISALLSGGFASLLEAGRSIQDEGETVNFIYRQGTRHNLFAINITSDVLLALVQDTSEFGDRLGTVWFYIQKTAGELKNIVKENAALRNQVTVDGLSQHMNDEFDKLFNEPKDESHS
jgi:predicted regulator of Ras-like GTPase activity (Roadblock/LC7/MglB family)